MSKNIVFCADGTWNGPEEQTRVSAVEDEDAHGEADARITNVVKLYANLGGATTPETLGLRNEQERLLADRNGNIVQVAKYIHGVGDSTNLVHKVMGGVFGMGIIARIVRGFTFVSRYYEPGDAIYIVGFSRGAYTARALGGMISSVGLLNRANYDPADKKEAYRLGLAAWCKYKGVSFSGAGKLTDIANHLLCFVAAFFARRSAAGRPDRRRADQVHRRVGYGGFARHPRSTLPTGAMMSSVSAIRRLSPKVERGFHAMAIDELRADFPVTRWDDRLGVRQVWFAGAHSDVGGGYAPDECGLSDVALDWMLRHLHELGLQLAVAPHARAGHTARRSSRYMRRGRSSPSASCCKKSRAVRPTDIVHDSVLRRWNADAQYRPAALGAFASEGLAALGTRAERRVARAASGAAGVTVSCARLRGYARAPGPRRAWRRAWSPRFVDTSAHHRAHRAGVVSCPFATGCRRTPVRASC